MSEKLGGWFWEWEIGVVGVGWLKGDFEVFIGGGF